MTPGKFIVHVSGPGCSGKSTLMRAIGERFPGIYLIEFDKLKWQLSGYDRNKHGPLIRNIERGLFEVVCRQSIPIVTNLFFTNEEEYTDFQSTAQKYGYALTFVQLTAPRELLLERFRARIRRSEEMGTKVSLTDEDVFVKQNVSRKCHVPPGTPVFDTSVTNAEAIADDIARKLSSGGN